MADLDHEPSDKKTGGTAAAQAVESPLSNLLAAIFGGNKKNTASARPAQPRTAASAPANAAGGTAAAFAGGPLMTVVVRNEFYRDGFRNMLRIAIAESIIIVALIITFIVYMNVSKPQNHYFATTADGRIMQLVPLNLANMGTSALMSWAAQSSTEVMTFGFHDYQRRMQQSSRHFTRHGWESFTNALQKSRIIEAVEANRQVVTAQPRSAPILIQEGVFNGKYRWVVDLPLARFRY